MKRQLTNAVNQRHARIILLSSGRVCNQEIARLIGCSPQWVRKIIHRFNAYGISGIEWFPWLHVCSTKPRKFMAETIEEIAAVALSPPSQLIGMTQWSLTKLRDYLIQQHIVQDISTEWLRVLLRREGIRWRRTKTWKQSKDPHFQAKSWRIRKLYRHRPKGGRRICVDEFGPLNLKPRHDNYLPGPHKHVERLRATYHRHGGVHHFLAAYDLETDQLYGKFSRTKTWCDWLGFLKFVRRRYPSNETLHIVLDNYSTHLKKPVVDWAKSHHIRFYFTPTNASWLNRIECEFTEMKKFCLENSDYQTHEEQEHVINSFLKWRNGQRSIVKQSWRSRHGHKKVA